MGVVVVVGYEADFRRHDEAGQITPSHLRKRCETMRLRSRDGVDINTVNDWRQHAPPLGGSAGWSDGKAAKELASAWCAAGVPEVPPELQELLNQYPGYDYWHFEEGFPRHPVSADLLRPDLDRIDLALNCLTVRGPVAVSIVACDDGRLGRTMNEEIQVAAASWASDDDDRRLKQLQTLVSIVLGAREVGAPAVGLIRRRLLTQIVRAWAFARRIGAPTAILVIHEFQTAGIDARLLRQNREDVDRLVERVTRGRHRELPPGFLAGPIPVPDDRRWTGVREWFIGKCVRQV